MKVPPLLAYSILRLLAFLVPLGIMWFFFPILREMWLLTVIFAALIGVSISVLFLRRPLSEVSESIHERRAGRAPEGREDADFEDGVGDASASADESPSASADEGPSASADEGPVQQRREAE